MPSTFSESDIPDFRNWTTSRLQTLLEDYQNSLGSIQLLYGKGHSEYRLYVRWIKGIEEELHRREQ